MASLPVRRCPVHGFRFYVDPPFIGIHELAAVGAKLALLDGGFWVVDQLTEIRYRRVTMADLPKHVTWNTRGKGRYHEDNFE